MSPLFVLIADGRLGVRDGARGRPIALLAR